MMRSVWFLFSGAVDLSIQFFVSGGGGSERLLVEPFCSEDCFIVAGAEGGDIGLGEFVSEVLGDFLEAGEGVEDGLESEVGEAGVGENLYRFNCSGLPIWPEKARQDDRSTYFSVDCGPNFVPSNSIKLIEILVDDF